MQRFLILVLFVFSSFVTASAWSAVTASPNPSTTGNFTVSWPATNGATYKVTQSVNGSSSQVYSGMSTQLSRSGLSNGSYQYTVIAELNGPFGIIPASLGSVTVSVSIAPSPPVVTIGWDSAEILAGQSAILTWLSPTADSCSLEGSNVIVSGSQPVPHYLAGQITQTIICTNTGGSTSASATINVIAAETEFPIAVDPANDLGAGDDFMGYLSGSFSVGSSGSASYSIPIVVPPGIGGVQPNLSLSYSSGAKNGLVGWGWNISGLSRIHRCPASLIRDDKITGTRDGEEYKLCLDGERLIKIGVNEYRTERESFRKITGSETTGFTVKTGNGREMEYGGSDDSRRESLDGASFIDWHLNKVSDISKNYMTYHYEKTTNGVHRIKRIEYTKNDDVAGINQTVTFDYEMRDDVLSGYWSGVYYQIDERLSTIEVHVDNFVGAGELVRRYRLKYQKHDGVTYADDAKTSRLEEVKICYDEDETQDDNSAQCSEPLAIDWTSRAESDFSFTEDTHISLVFDTYSTRHLMADYDGDGINEVVYNDDVNVYMIEQGETLNFDASNIRMTIPNPDLILINAADLNNDGRSDLVWLDNNGSPNSGADNARLLVSFASDSGFELPVSLMQGKGYLLYTHQFLDVNGDGLLDIFRNPNAFFYDYNFDEITAGFERIDISINLGNGTFAPFTSWGSRGQVPPGSPFKVTTQFAEMNGDGLVDLVHCRHGTATTIPQGEKPGCFSFEVSINKGDHFNEPVKWGLPNSTPGFMLTDMNGDGLADFVWVSKNDGVFVNINNGGSFEGVYRRWLEEDITPGEWSVPPYTLVDINVDGRPDLVYRPKGLVNTRQDLFVAYNQGSSIGGGFTEPVPLDLNSLYFNGMDFDGNGVTDLSFLGAYDVHYGGNWVVGNTIHRNDLEPHLVTGIRVNSESEISISYSTLNDPEVHTRAEISADDVLNGVVVAERTIMQTLSNDSAGTVTGYFSSVTSTRSLVEQVETSNGIGGLITDAYHYSGFLRHRSGWGGLGFAKVESTHTVENTEARLEQTRTVSEYLQDVGDGFKAAGLLKSSTQYASNAQREWQQISQQVNEWHVQTIADDIDDEPFDSPHYRIHRVASHSITNDLNGAAVADSSSYMLSYGATAALACEASPVASISSGSTAHEAFDSYGNVHQVASLTCGESQVFTNTAKTVYENKTTGDYWVLGLVTNSQVTSTAPDTDGNLQSLTREQTNTYYDSGLPLMQTREPGGSDLTRSTTLSNYDAFGTPRTITEAWIDTDGLEDLITSRFSTVDVSYSSNGTRTIVARNPALHETTTVMEGKFGQLKSHTDANDLTTESTFDALGRLDTITAPDNSTVVNRYRECNNCGAQSPYARLYVHSKATGASAQRSYFDAFGRNVGQRVLGLSGAPSYTQIDYDVAGRVAASSDPFFVPADRYDTEYKYDSLGRVTNITAVDGGTTVRLYNGLEITSTNALLQQRVQWSNAIGQSVVMQDHYGTQIKYAYDPLGNLERTEVKGSEGGAGVVTKMGYDLLGRQLFLDDPSAGRIDYTYNGLDLMHTSTDAKTQRTEFTYDDLGRQITRVDDADAANPELRTHEWIFDISSGDGRLDGVVGYDTDGEVFTEDYGYNDFGLPTTAETTIQGTMYSTETHYDSFNRPVGVEYPTGYTVVNHFNEYGYRDQISDALSKVTLWEATEADARGNITNSVHGNGVITKREYDPETGLVNLIKATHTDEGPVELVVQNQRFHFDFLGNLTRRADLRVALGVGYEQAFCYDKLNRLTAVREGSCIPSDEDITYDALGNIIQRVMSGDVTNTYAYDPSNPYKLASTTMGGSYSYDDNGNITGGDGRTISYTSFDKPKRMTKDGNVVDITYGPDQNRIKRVDNDSITTTYVSGIYEKIVEGLETKHIHYIGDVAISVWEKTGAVTKQEVSYLHHDHLGSLVAKSDENAESVEWLANDPWGLRQDESWMGSILDTSYQPTDTRKGFTGHEHMDGVGLIHMNGRVYDPTIGRFLSADPIIQAPDNTQSFNRYAYVFNNPLRYTDPSGFEACDSTHPCTIIQLQAPSDGGGAAPTITVRTSADGEQSFKDGDNWRPIEELSDYGAVFVPGAADGSTSASIVSNGRGPSSGGQSGGGSGGGGSPGFAPAPVPPPEGGGRRAPESTLNRTADGLEEEVLVRGKKRTWGSYLPGTTAGNNAQSYWADKVVRAGGGFTDAPLEFTALVFASMWTDETAAEVSFTLGTAGLGSLPNIGSKLFLSETFGVTSTKFANSVTGVTGLWNVAGSLFKIGWSGVSRNGGGMMMRIGIGSVGNTARFHFNVPKSFVPNSFANGSIQVKKSLLKMAQ